MPIYSRVSTKTIPPTWYAWPPVDTLYDYVSFLGQNDGVIADLPAGKQGTEIAVIGAGAAGMVAAYELLKIGLSPVIFESSDRIGGRAWSQPFTEADGTPATAFAEMGSMRFPPSGKVFMHYVTDTFDLPFEGSFPDPGKVLTRLYFENNQLAWQPGQPPPAPFDRIQKDWDNFIGPITNPILEALHKGDLATVQAQWQALISKYRDISFYLALRQGIPTWTDEDLSRFGALGIGSGGFGPLYQVGFLEMLRLVVNMLETDQEALQFGISSLMSSFYTACVTQPNGDSVSLQTLDAVQFNTQIISIENGPDGNVVLQILGSDGAATTREYPAVIIANTTRAMEYLGLTLSPPTGVETVIDEPVKVCLRNLHLMNSSKLFIRTETKFWKTDPTIPQNIQTDELPRGVYTLDYSQTDNGVVLISYTWGDDSTKLLALTVEERFEMFKAAIAKASPEFAAQLIPVNGEIINVDWQLESGYFGAFKLNYPGQEPDVSAAYYQFLTVLDPTQDRGVYLAGDSISWTGGWTEGAFETGLNAACAVAQHMGATLSATSPLSQKPNLYNYGQPVGTSVAKGA